jgi:hypothetical protein
MHCCMYGFAIKFDVCTSSSMCLYMDFTTMFNVMLILGLATSANLCSIIYGSWIMCMCHVVRTEFELRLAYY